MVGFYKSFIMKSLLLLACLVACLMITQAKEEKFVITSVNCAIETNSASSIRISGKEYSRKRDGLNMVVYNPISNQVVTSISFGHTKSKRFVDFFEAIKPHMIVLVTSQVLCSKKSSTDLRIQKSILHGLNRMAFDTQDMSPLNTRSAVFIFCKDECSDNITSSIEFPYQNIHTFSEDPIMVSFVISTIQTEVSSKENDIVPRGPNTTLLYAIIGCCVVFIVVSCFIFAGCWYKRTKSEQQNLERQRSCSKDYISNCELTYCDDYKSRLQQTTSARLFDRLKSKSRKSQKEGANQKEGTNTSFATYIKVEHKNKCQLYKVPSGVSKHQPPSLPPPHNILKPRDGCHESNPSLADSYLLPHEYANPEREGTETSQERGKRSQEKMNLLHSDYEFLDLKDSTRDETSNNFAEYTSLEEYLNDDYVVPASLRWQDDFES